MKCGIKWACKVARNRGSFVVVSGWSAGGHLITQALSCMNLEEKTEGNFDLVKGIVTFSGVFDVRPLVKTYVNEPLQLTR